MSLMDAIMNFINFLFVIIYNFFNWFNSGFNYAIYRIRFFFAKIVDRKILFPILDRRRTVALVNTHKDSSAYVMYFLSTDVFNRAIADAQHASQIRVDADSYNVGLEPYYRHLHTFRNLHRAILGNWFHRSWTMISCLFVKLEEKITDDFSDFLDSDD